MIVESIFNPEFMPTKAHESDAGIDLKSTEKIVIFPGCHRLVPTGVRVRLEDGVVGFVCPRSGLAAKHSVTVLNAPGVVDAGYIGEIFVNLYNAGSSKFTVMPGDRIAQLVALRFEPAELKQVEKLDDTDRGESGHGSTGV